MKEREREKEKILALVLRIAQSHPLIYEADLPALARYHLFDREKMDYSGRVL